MKKANIIKVVNTTPYPLILYHKKYYSKGEFILLCGSNSFALMDFQILNKFVDLDLCFFQFFNDKKKINIKDIHKYGCSIEYSFLKEGNYEDRS